MGRKTKRRRSTDKLGMRRGSSANNCQSSIQTAFISSSARLPFMANTRPFVFRNGSERSKKRARLVKAREITASNWADCCVETSSTR